MIYFSLLFLFKLSINTFHLFYSFYIYSTFSSFYIHFFFPFSFYIRFFSVYFFYNFDIQISKALKPLFSFFLLKFNTKRISKHINSIRY